jgi:hypothetical protein
MPFKMQKPPLLGGFAPGHRGGRGDIHYMLWVLALLVNSQSRNGKVWAKRNFSAHTLSSSLHVRQLPVLEGDLHVRVDKHSFGGESHLVGGLALHRDHLFRGLP